MSDQELLNQCRTDQIEKIVIGVTIIFNNTCLCLKREGSDFMGDLVELPSGGKEKNETIYNSLIREVEEETGIVLNLKNSFDYLSSFDYVSSSGKKARQINFAINLNKLPCVKLNPKEHTEYYWLSLSELNNYNISDETKKVIIDALMLQIKN
jgi:8-oxo-dGTP diphosphatase